jgi:sialate O-acetylesterase
MSRARIRTAWILAGVMLASLVAGGARGEIAVPSVFSDHMVLQREMPVRIFGTAAAGEPVAVQFRDQRKVAVADGDGAWSVTLDPLVAGGPDALVISGGNTIRIEDVLVGEVWVGSGQSNMAGIARGYAAKDPVLARLMSAGPYPRLRLLANTQQGLSGGRWTDSSPEIIGGFSALLFAFGLRLHEELDVPVGLMLGAVGGTPSGAWLSAAALAADDDCQRQLAAYAAGYDAAAAQAAHERQLAAYERQLTRARAAGTKEPRRPRPPSPPGKVRGEEPGFLYEAHIRPLVGYGIRGVLWDQGEGGTGLGVDQFTLMGALIRGWRNEWGQGAFPFIYVQKPSGGGCGWDVTDPDTAQADPFRPLPATVPDDGGAVEAFVNIMRHPATAMVIASDLGSGIHPINKSGYGHRAARVALATAYRRPLEYYGPLYASHAVEGGRIRVRFSHVGQGLAFRHGDGLQGFAVAGADRIFRWADAVIDGDTVVLSSPGVGQPVAVRYAFAADRSWANLFNRDGLPAVPFRTDDWEVPDVQKR